MHGYRSGTQAAAAWQFVSLVAMEPHWAVTKGTMPTRKSTLFDVDEDKIQYYLSVCIEDMGFDCTNVGTGELPLDELERQSFGVVLLDVNLPGLSGFEVLEHVRIVDPQAGVIIISGMDDPDIARHAVASLGADLFMTKPCSPSDLREAIGRVTAKNIPVA